MIDPRTIRLGLGLLRAEGPRALFDRLHDRRLDRQRRASFAPAGATQLRAIFTRPAPVLNVLAQPPHRRLGGVAHQFLARYPEEAAQRSCAVLYRDQDGYRLEAENSGNRASRLWPAPFPPATMGIDVDPSVRDPDFERIVLAVADLAGARAIHCEGVTGLPFASLTALAQQGLPLVLSLHDFGLFCARPHLLEEPAGRFCGYSLDCERCGRCLGSPGPPQRGLQESRRAATVELLAHAMAVIFPSPFLRDRHAALFPGATPRSLVVAPSGLCQSPAPVRRRAPAGRRKVAFVGSVQRHKGSTLFEELVRSTSDQSTGPEWHVFGGGDRETLLRLRTIPRVHVHGYYRAGALPARLVAAGMDCALLLSVVPEAYCLTLDECALAGVPVVAFDHGAIAERIRERGGGSIAPLANGVDGLREALDRGPQGEIRETIEEQPRPGHAVRLLYEALGLGQ